MAKSRCDLSAAVLKMLVVKLKLFLTHFRFTDNQHDQGRGVGWLSNGLRLGDFWKGIDARNSRNSAYIEVW